MYSRPPGRVLTAAAFGAVFPWVGFFEILRIATSDVLNRFLAWWDVITNSPRVIRAGSVWLSKPKDLPSGGNYSAVDRALHRIAFSTPAVQQAAADIEEGIFGKRIDTVPDRPPIFITALPRAGTTVLLNALHELPTVATHLYRDMPFVMAPLLWSRFSGVFRQRSVLKERAHGDGIMVGYDSPEAFEEILWRAIWPGKYHRDRIERWSVADVDPEATVFFRRHFRKVVAVRCGGDGRYVSKNNANIARLDLLPAMFPDADIVVPIRDPVEHAASLLRQHENFLGQHALDPFVKRYMADIGHFEFGELHRPIDFDGFDRLTAGRGPRDRDYWLAYWIAAYREVRAHRDRLHILPQAALGTDSGRILSELCLQIGLDPAGADFARHLHPVPPRADASRYAPVLVAEARALYAELAG